MKMKQILLATLTLSAIALTGCAELKSLGNSMKEEAIGIANTAKDSAVTRAKAEAGAKASQATGKVLGTSY